MAMQRTSFDVALASAAVLRFQDGPTIDFQFPPRVTTDSRKGDWNDGSGNNFPGSEPVAYFEKPGPREITLSFTYIVEGGTWTTKKISEIVRNLRGYFTRSGSELAQRKLVVFYKLWRLSASSEMTCRIKGVDVKHSETIVTSCLGSGLQNLGSITPGPAGLAFSATSQALQTVSANEAYPLRTDVTLDLRLWTKGLETSPTVQDVEGLKFETPEWY